MGASSNDQVKGAIVEGLLSSITDAEKLRSKKSTGMIREFSYGKPAVDAAAGTLTRVCIGRLTQKFRVNDDVRILPAAALTASDTVNAVVALEIDDGAGGAATVVASIATTTASGNWVAGTAKTVTLTAANAVIDGDTATKYLWLNITKVSTGTAVPVCTLCFSAELVS